jgi:uncharacterized membrane protein
MVYYMNLRYSMKPILKWIFAISLVLNFLLVGVLIGRNAPEFKPMPGPRHFAKLDISTLPDDKKALFLEAMKEMDEKNSGRAERIAAARQAVIDVLEAPNFNEAAFIERSNELDSIFSEGKGRVVEAMAHLARQFNQEERKVLAEHLRRPPNRDKPQEGKRGR